MSQEQPFIPASKELPEITLKAVILGIILTVVLCSSNAYLALKVGATVSGSIPAAIIAMGLLRFFKNSNILENNIVQTIASVGEAVASGIVFTMPVLLILHFWLHINYEFVFLLTVIGGILGVLMMIPLRRILLDHKDLGFPEGRAIAEVLKSSESTNSSLQPLVVGSLIGGIISFLQDGLQLLTDGMSYWKTNGHIVFGFGLGFSPAIIAAGYIVGVGVAIATLVGIVIGWIIGVPVLSYIYGVPHLADFSQVSNYFWDAHIRYIGVGTMLVGGLWTIVVLCKPIYQGIKASFSSVKVRKENELIRTEQDISIIKAAVGFVVLIALGYFLLFSFLGVSPYFVQHLFVREVVCLLATALIVAGLFVFPALAAYFAGLIGASNSPSSGLSISALLT